LAGAEAEQRPRGRPGRVVCDAHGGALDLLAHVGLASCDAPHMEREPPRRAEGVRIATREPEVLEHGARAALELLERRRDVTRGQLLDADLEQQIASRAVARCAVTAARRGGGRALPVPRRRRRAARRRASVARAPRPAGHLRPGGGAPRRAHARALGARRARAPAHLRAPSPRAATAAAAPASVASASVASPTFTHFARSASSLSNGNPRASRCFRYATEALRASLRTRAIVPTRSLTEIAPRASSRLNRCEHLITQS